jgi:hypothetical protein
VTVINDAIIDHYVLCRDTTIATGFVFAGLHTDCIVTHIEGATTDHHVLTTLYVHAVAVLAIPGVADRDVIEDEVFAAHRMEVPRRAVLERDTLEKDILASYEMEQHGAQEGFHDLP